MAQFELNTSPLIVATESSSDLNPLTGLNANFTEIDDFTEGWEGGLTDDLDDNASVDPVPGTYTKMMRGKMKTSNHWHTNKGVTWATFKSNAKLLGYNPTPDLFFAMPKNIWLAIAKKRYWDPIALDQYKSQAIANLMFSWQWGSGYSWRLRVQRYLKSRNIAWAFNKNYVAADYASLAKHFNTLAAKDEKNTFLQLIEQKKQFLQSLADWPKYGKGWSNRLDDLKNKSLKFITENKAAAGGGAFFFPSNSGSDMEAKSN